MVLWARVYILYSACRFSASQERDRYKEIRWYHRDWGAARSTMRTKAPIVPPRNPSFFLAARRPLLAASSDHGDIKDACNGTSGGGCAHPRALKAVQPRLHHARLAARHLAQRQHGMRCRWRLLEADLRQQHGSCRCMDFTWIELLVTAWLLKVGPRLTRSNLEYVILQGSQFRRRKRCSRRLDLGWTSCHVVWRAILALYRRTSSVSRRKSVRFLKETGPSGHR